MNPWSLIVRPVKQYMTEKGARGSAEKGGKFEVIKGDALLDGEKITLTDPLVREFHPTIKVLYGPGSPAEMKHFAL